MQGRGDVSVGRDPLDEIGRKPCCRLVGILRISSSANTNGQPQRLLFHIRGTALAAISTAMVSEHIRGPAPTAISTAMVSEHIRGPALTAISTAMVSRSKHPGGNQCRSELHGAVSDSRRGRGRQGGDGINPSQTRSKPDRTHLAIFMCKGRGTKDVNDWDGHGQPQYLTPYNIQRNLRMPLPGPRLDSRLSSIAPSHLPLSPPTSSCRWRSVRPPRRSSCRCGTEA